MRHRTAMYRFATGTHYRYTRFPTPPPAAVWFSAAPYLCACLLPFVHTACQTHGLTPRNAARTVQLMHRTFACPAPVVLRAKGGYRCSVHASPRFLRNLVGCRVTPRLPCRPGRCLPIQRFRCPSVVPILQLFLAPIEPLRGSYLTRFTFCLTPLQFTLRWSPQYCRTP